jgi:hypothetical protein
MNGIATFYSSLVTEKGADIVNNIATGNQTASLIRELYFLILDEIERSTKRSPICTIMPPIRAGSTCNGNQHKQETSL